MATLRGQPLVLNFWATWCPPCVKEMPEIDRFQREFAARGWQVLGLAVDRPQPVREFLARTPVGYTIAMAGLEGTELSRQLGNYQRRAAVHGGASTATAGSPTASWARRASRNWRAGRRRHD